MCKVFAKHVLYYDCNFSPNKQVTCCSYQFFYCTSQGRIQRFLKDGALYVGHHGWPAKKILGFRWSEKVEITLETISFWQNISISSFKFSPFLLTKTLIN